MIRPRSRLCLLPLVASAVIGGCSTPSTPRADLLGDTYRLVARFYFRPVQTEKISEAGLDALTKLDRDLIVEVDNRQVVIKRGATPLGQFHAAAPNDWQAWGEISDRAATVAAAASPTIAQLSEDDLDDALIEGAVTALDHNSHYLSPKAAARSVLRESKQTSLDTGDRERQRGTTGASLSGKPLQMPASVSLRTDRGIGVIHIRRFTSLTSHLVRQALARAFASTTKPLGVVLDLRDDPGGTIAAATDVADLFLDRGVVVTLEGRDPRDREVFAATHDHSAYEKVPLVVIVNGGSASAAEVLAAALQDNRRALVIGTSTFGKGTSQRVISLINGGELWLTSAYMRSPAGYLLDGHGVVPDVCTRVRPNAYADGSRLAVVERFHSLVARPRILLTRAEWAELRRICPPSVQISADDLELETAKEILRN